MGKFTMVFGIALVLAIYAAVNVYIGHRLYRWATIMMPTLNVWLFATIYAVLAMTFILAFLPLPSLVTTTANWIGSYWLGVFCYLLLFMLAIDIVLVIGTLLKIIPRPIPTTVHFWSGLLVVIFTIGVVSYGIYHAKIIKNVHYDVRITEQQPPLNMKMVLMSDLHLGAVGSEQRLEEIVQRVNKLEPDIIVIPGDIFNDDFAAIKQPQRASELLQQLSARYGVYGTLGNHDSGKTFSQMVQFLAESDVTLLTDEAVVIDDRLTLLGRVDPSPIGGFDGLTRQDVQPLLQTITNDLPIVVLDHTPSHLEQYGNQVDLILSGHTHKGQLFPGSLITNRVFEVDYGYYQKDTHSPQVIVTSGVGTWGMPMRVGTNSEIVEINLQ